MWIISKHRHIKPETLSEYLDGQLAGRERDRVGRAVAECADCQEELESLRATVSLLHTLPAFSPSRSFVLTAAPAAGPAITTEPPRFSPRRVPGWAYAGAASLAGLAVILLVLADGGLPSLQWSGGSEEPAALAMAESAPAPAPAQEMLVERTVSASSPAAAPVAKRESMPAPAAMAEPTAAPQPMSAPAPAAEMMAAVESAPAMERASAPVEQASVRPTATPRPAMAAEPASAAQSAVATAATAAIREATPAPGLEKEVPQEVAKEVVTQEEPAMTATPVLETGYAWAVEPTPTAEPAIATAETENIPQDTPAPPDQAKAPAPTLAPVAAAVAEPTTEPTAVGQMGPKLATEPEPVTDPAAEPAAEPEAATDSDSLVEARDRETAIEPPAAESAKSKVVPDIALATPDVGRDEGYSPATDGRNP